jgi:hypothetical protein
MAQAALQEEFTFPAGGIADFYKDDEELAAMDREDAQRAFGNNGIANFQDVATRMASYGRYGDDKLVHAETGELIVPKALIEDNPKLRDSIFGHLRDMGIEDPERYVVGSRANSINPDTGLPEFFLKNLFKKVSRAVKKVSKKVVKLVKKAAPIVLPIALSFTPLGAIYGAALGSGIGTLIQGGSIKDALRNAVIAGATGAVAKGISGKGNFLENIRAEGANPLGRLSETTSNVADGKFFGSFTGSSPVAEAAVGETAVSTTDVAKTDVSGAGLELTGNPNTDAIIKGANLPSQGSPYIDTAQALNTDNFNVITDADGTFKLVPKTTFDMSTAVDLPTKPPGFFESVSKGNFKEAFLPTQEVTATQLQAANPGMTLAQAKQAIADAAPGFTRSFAPSAAAIGGATYLAGGFDAPEVPEEDLGPTGADMLRLTPYEYLIGQQNLRTRGSQGPTVVPTTYVAEGGEIFPRRVGGIMPNEGTPGKDSVRAMLMPGEFVMTTDAVKGLGNGDNDKGISNMYQMMRGLEAKGRAMA